VSSAHEPLSSHNALKPYLLVLQSNLAAISAASGTGTGSGNQGVISDQERNRTARHEPAASRGDRRRRPVGTASLLLVRSRVPPGGRTTPL
ncbi:MAG: hypothetical protein LC749_20410, partial [Actinobacteria bacterium]|nr:hypothetical protein [Actinomycetota bacterium]